MIKDVIPLTGHWAPGKRRHLAPHTNSGLEVVYVRHGQPVWQIDGRVERVPPGSVFFSLPWQVHGGATDIEPGCELYYVVLRLDRHYPTAVRSFAFHRSLQLPRREQDQLARLLIRSEQHTHVATAALTWLLPQLVREVQRDDFGQRVVLLSLARAMLMELARAIRLPRSVGARQDDAERRVTRFLESLPRRCGEPWSIDTMAMACRLGRTRFAQLLKDHTGDTPIMALNRVRIDMARTLLRDTALPVTQIALRCGFTSPQYFSRVFRDYTGCPARDFRRQALV